MPSKFGRAGQHGAPVDPTGMDLEMQRTLNLRRTPFTADNPIPSGKGTKWTKGQIAEAKRENTLQRMNRTGSFRSPSTRSDR